MNQRLLIVAMTTLCSISSGIHADERFAGKWKMTSSTAGVEVKSWGRNCGPEPRSHSTEKVRDVEISSDQKHLVFSLGGVRTDRCWTPNPRMRSLSESIAPGAWKRTCETLSDDPKYEHGEYSLIAKGDDRLAYLAVTDFDWTLKGDHCLARLEEKRVYVRVEQVTDEKKEMPTGDGDSIAESECDEHGALERLAIRPHQARIGPTERICLKAVGVDAVGCSFPVDASWKVMQYGEEVRGLISKEGCFSAGDTAADAEGTYSVTARAEGKRASTELSVIFPDMGDLAGARLPQTVTASGTDAASADRRATISVRGETDTVVIGGDSAAVPVSPLPNRSWRSNALALTIGAVAMAGAVLAFLLLFRYRSRRATIPQPEGSTEKMSGSLLENGKDREIGGAARDMVCPECANGFSADARYCPFDGQDLVPRRGNAGSGEIENDKDSGKGMVCPKCHRGYDFGVRRCPYDSESLVLYREWRAQYRKKSVD